MRSNHFTDKQVNVLKNANARWNFLIGAAASGKTYISYYLFPKRLLEHPSGSIMILGKTERTIKRNVLHPMQELYGLENVSNISSDGTCKIFGRRVYVIGVNDERSENKLRGAALSYALADEITTYPENVVQRLSSLLRVPGAQCDATANPESSNHYIKTRYIDNTELDKTVFNFCIDDNTFLDKSFVNALKKEYSGIWYRRLILGEWCTAEGLVYPMFDKDIHIINEAPDIVEYVTACDYGFTHPTVFVLIGRDQQGVAYLIKEHRSIGKTDSVYSDEYKDFIAGYNIKWCWVDPSAASFKNQLFVDGFSNVISANNDVINGIRYLASRIQQNKFKIISTNKDFIKEIEDYSWDDKAQKIGIDRPIKINDDSVDAVRYAVYSWRNQLGF